MWPIEQAIAPVTEVLKATRQLIDGVYYTIHFSADGSVRVNTGRDDQRPEADGVLFFRPLCVEQMLPGGEVYTYYWFCGKCRKKIGSLGECKEYCPRCGVGIGHYVFAMGVEKLKGMSIPDELPKDYQPPCSA